jgi:hypothetical protein
MKSLLSKAKHIPVDIEEERMLLSVVEDGAARYKEKRREERGTTRGVQCTVCGVRCTVCGVRCTVCGVRYGTACANTGVTLLLPLLRLH